MSGQGRKKKESVDWESFGWDIYYTVGKALDYWCWDIVGDPLEI